MAENMEQGLEALQKLEGDLKTKQEEFDKLKSLTAEEQSKKAALEQELSRVQKQIDESRENKRKEETTFSSQLRNENLDKIRQRVIKEFGYEGNADAIKALEETFKRFDTKAITEDKIYDDYLSAHVVLNKSKLLETAKTLKTQQEEAEKFKAEMSGGVGAGNQPPEGGSVTLTPEDMWAIKWSGIPVEKYKELKSKGKL
jgi:hypothetical protein